MSTRPATTPAHAWFALGATLLCSLATPARAQIWSTTEGPPTGQYVFGVGAGGTSIYSFMLDRVARSDDGGDSWLNISGNLSLSTVGFFRGTFLEDGPRVFLARADGVWKTDDAGASWQQVAGGLPVARAFHILRVGPRLFILLDAFQQPANQLFSSDDGGDTWTPVALPGDINLFAEALRSDGQNLFITPTFFGPWYRSPDLGATWIAPGAGAPTDLDAGPALVGSTLVVPTNGFVYHSNDAGATWAKLSSTGWDTRIPKAIVSVNGTLLSVYREGGASVLRSTDLGRTWAASDAGLPECVEGVFESAAVRDGVAYVAGYTGVYRSFDLGLSWSHANGAGDAGISAPTVSEMVPTASALLAINPNRERVYLFASNIWSSSNAGFPACASPLSIASIDGKVYLGTNRSGIFRSGDDGATLTPLNSGVPQYNGTAGNQYREIGAVALHQGRVFAATAMGTEFFNQAFQFSGGGMIRLNEAGTAWQRINTGYPIIARNNFNEPVYDPAVGLGDAGGALLVGTSFSGIVRSTNLGANWSASNTGLPRDNAGRPPVFSCFLSIDGVVLAGSQGFFFGNGSNPSEFGVFASTDAGQSWTRASNGIPNGVWVNDLEWLGGVAFAAARDGVYRTTDTSVWTRVGASSLPAGECLALATKDGDLYASIKGRGVWRLKKCAADVNGDWFVNGNDHDEFAELFDIADPGADFNGDGFVNGNDYDEFADAFDQGC